MSLFFFFSSTQQGHVPCSLPDACIVQFMSSPGFLHGAESAPGPATKTTGNFGFIIIPIPHLLDPVTTIFMGDYKV